MFQIWPIWSNDYASKTRIEIMCKKTCCTAPHILSEPDFLGNSWKYRTLARMSTWRFNEHSAQGGALSRMLTRNFPQNSDTISHLRIARVPDSDSDFWVPGPILFKKISFYCSSGSQDLPEKLNWVGDLNFNGVFAQNCWTNVSKKHQMSWKSFLQT